ncbi:hypothetical protein PLESTB_001324200 [Pleodorina starrii]|uniref:Rubredoxin-like domain-containing protein n=1 Tax=Pleodorina starrii TaxID=330485 RepID=A0A9W6BTH1_9CHLO|nr:hypothetical protein PLESTM_001620200 [Pleodorina starrii]GLC58151.1 hypothetical protein PLESTB_001324200 [Pleodorina starrii]GLC75579.1 hypothetical protein PLESTF_001659400 [Pleodorina starrii]
MAAMQTTSFLGNRTAFKSAVRGGVSRQSRVSVNALFTKSKPVAKTAYVCLDCGYLYDEATPFEDVKSYSCPVCGAPKRRFKELKNNSLRNNDPKSMVARKEKLRDQIVAEGGNPDEGQNEFLIATGAAIAVTLGLLAYLTQQ